MKFAFCFVVAGGLPTGIRAESQILPSANPAQNEMLKKGQIVAENVQTGRGGNALAQQLTSREALTGATWLHSYISLHRSTRVLQLFESAAVRNSGKAQVLLCRLFRSRWLRQFKGEGKRP
jgi:hypothetical protein